MSGPSNARSDLCACFGAGLTRVMHCDVPDFRPYRLLTFAIQCQAARACPRQYNCCAISTPSYTHMTTHAPGITRTTQTFDRTIAGQLVATITPDMSCHYVKLYCEQTRV